MEYLITFRSITPAQRAQQILNHHGAHCRLQRTPRWMEEKGCGYSLHISSKNLQELVALLDRFGIVYRKIYLQRSNGKTEEVEL